MNTNGALNYCYCTLVIENQTILYNPFIRVYDLSSYYLFHRNSFLPQIGKQVWTSLRGKKVYLQTSQDSDTLVKDINSLGGTVCQFLSSRVDIVVVDSFDQISKQEENVLPCKQGSRAQMLVTKALKSTKQLLQKSFEEKAQQFGFEIVLVSEFRKKLSEMAIHKKRDFTAKPEKQQKQDQDIFVRSLKPPFIKVEDHSRNYMPLVKEFDVWPSFDFDSSTEDNGKEGGRQRKNYLAKNVIMSFCECCEIHFTNLEDHLKSKQHREFAENDKNYESLDKLIKKGPSLEDFSKKSKRGEPELLLLCNRQKLETYSSFVLSLLTG